MTLHDPDMDQTDSRDKDARQGIQSVEAGMSLIVALERGGQPMSLSQVAKGAGMAPSKAHRYLVSLGRTGLVSQSPTSGLYDLGPAFRRIGAEALRRTDEVGTVSAQMPGLRDRTGHAVNLAAWGDRGPVIVRSDYGSFPLPITVRVGATLPLSSSSVGLVCMAWLPRPVTDPVLDVELAAASEPRLARTELEKDVETTRERGYALTVNRVLPGVTTLAAPVLDSTGWLTLTVAVALPPGYGTEHTLASVAGDLLTTTRQLSVDLGWSDDSRLNG